MKSFPLQTEMLPAPFPPAIDDPRVVPRTILPLPGGRTLAYAEAGAGPDLVAIHGTLMTLEDFWLGPVPSLAEHFRVVAVDRPGHGFSERRRLVDASPWRQAELIRSALRDLGLRRPVIVGHSFGGAVALAYGMQFPDDVAGIVAVAPPCFPELRLEHAVFGPRAVPLLGEVLSDALRQIFDPPILPALWATTFAPQPMPSAFAANFPFELVKRSAQLVAEGEDANALLPGLARSATRYAGCRAPVRILGGGSDLVVNPLTQGRLAAAIIPGARFHWLPGVGHMLHHVASDAVVSAARAILHARPSP